MAAHQRHDPDPAQTTSFAHITTDSSSRNRPCDGDIAKVSKLAWWILYGGLNYTLRAPDGNAGDLEHRLLNGALHWATIFNWPTPHDNRRSNYCSIK